jgi:hypothetical protein
MLGELIARGGCGPMLVEGQPDALLVHPVPPVGEPA